MASFRGIQEGDLFGFYHGKRSSWVSPVSPLFATDSLAARLEELPKCLLLLIVFDNNNNHIHLSAIYLHLQSLEWLQFSEQL